MDSIYENGHRRPARLVEELQLGTQQVVATLAVGKSQKARNKQENAQEKGIGERTRSHAIAGLISGAG